LPTPCASRIGASDDLDLRAIFAEAILNRTPWHMWTCVPAKPAPGAGTIEAREVLEVRLPRSARSTEASRPSAPPCTPDEMSPHPEAVLVTGDRLRELTPDMGHLVHMPTHIDVQCGHYRDRDALESERSSRTVSSTTAPAR